VSAPRRNVELKATDPDPDRSLTVCLELGADDRGVLVQRDTYFRVPDGRLKLREETPGGAALIQYDRPDAAHARESRYRIVAIEDPQTLKEALDAALGTLVVVDKERRLLLWEGVRIHFDRVRGLGSFLELEGVAPEGSDLAPERERVAQLSAALGLEGRVLADSYSDRLLAVAQGGPGAPAGSGAAAA
jgi:predicted adenylyl cyclase CyaB